MGAKKRARKAREVAQLDAAVKTLSQINAAVAAAQAVKMRGMVKSAPTGEAELRDQAMRV